VPASGFDTGFNERGPIQRIRPDRRNDDSSAAREVFKGIRIETVCDDRLQCLGLDVQRVTEFIELVQTAAGNCPAKVTIAAVLP
jgi:hypothetical protein